MQLVALVVMFALCIFLKVITYILYIKNYLFLQTLFAAIISDVSRGSALGVMVSEMPRLYVQRLFARTGPCSVFREDGIRVSV